MDLDVMNGLAAWLGVPARLAALDRKLKKQNPQPMADKVENLAQMEAALSRFDRFDLSRTPNFEPRRGAAVPTWRAAATAPLLYLPLPSGPDAAVVDWLTALDRGAPPAEGMNQGQVRHWRLARPGHRSFAVLRHPAVRAHAAFCDRILATGPGSFGRIRDALRRSFALELPEGGDWAMLDPATHRAGFLRFLAFLKANLAGQTSLRVDPAWASQTAILSGMAGVAPLDVLLREDRLDRDLPWLCDQVGLPAPAAIGPTDPHRARLDAIFDAAVGAAVREASPRDFETFGFPESI